MGKTDTESATRNNRTICLPFSQDVYNDNIQNPETFRKCLNERIELFPELFPAEIFREGYQMKDIYHSKKMLISIRRIEISGIAYTVRPSFLTPYLTGLVDEVEKALFMRKFNVPFWALSHNFGKDPMYWYRIEQSLGRNSIVGTTIRQSTDIPQHLAADEKHTRILGEKTYVATTVGKGCILGVAVAKNAGTEALTKAYEVYQDEAQSLQPEYSPDTVNMDGWQATRHAWKSLFPSVAIICCFLHVFIKIRDRAKKKYRDIFDEAASKLWDCYRAESKMSFSQRIRRLIEWCKKYDAPDVISAPIKKLRKNIISYKSAYDHPNAHRTSNMVDRLMQRMDRHLFSTQYFHGSMDAAQLSIRGWALIHNFAPYNPETAKKHNGFKSPSESLNQFRYHDNWLHNLYISASLGGHRSPPQNPI
ncbi:MAG: hypothetical protein RBR67_15350 [Desulfobacterium sp.]|nr:hypothetical protein [Desulfobacterium sp.]